MTLLQKEAATMPRDARRPPTSMTGRQPKRFTHTLQSGPGGHSVSGSPPSPRLAQLPAQPKRPQFT